MRNETTLAMVVLSSLLGCATPQKFVATSTFDAAQAKSQLIEGANTIRGSALIRQRAGGVVTCAGREVHLIPSTAYAEEKVKAIYGPVDRGYNPVLGGKRLVVEGEDPRYRQLMSKTTCDAQGFFKFDKVADGSFYIVSLITWQVNDYSHEGGGLMQRVTLRGAETKEVVLAP